MDEIFASYVKENPEMLAYATELTSASTNLFTLRALYEKEFNELPDMTGRGMEIKLRLANALFEKRYNQPIFTNTEIFAPSSASPKPKQEEGEMKKSNGTEGPSVPQNEEAPAKKRGRPSLFAEGDESSPPEAEDSPAPLSRQTQGSPAGIEKPHTRCRQRCPRIGRSSCSHERATGNAVRHERVTRSPRQAALPH